MGPVRETWRGPSPFCGARECDFVFVTVRGMVRRSAPSAPGARAIPCSTSSGRGSSFRAARIILTRLGESVAGCGRDRVSLSTVVRVRNSLPILVIPSLHFRGTHRHVQDLHWQSRQAHHRGAGKDAPGQLPRPRGPGARDRRRRQEPRLRDRDVPRSRARQGGDRCAVAAAHQRPRARRQ